MSDLKKADCFWRLEVNIKKPTLQRAFISKQSKKIKNEALLLR